MSDQKKQSVIAATNLEIRNSSHRLRLHAKLLGLVAVVVVGLVVGVAIHQFSHHNNHNKLATKAQPKQSVADQATGLILTGKYTAAQQLLDASIAKTTDPATQGGYYEQKANLACGHGDYTNGLHYAQKADSLKPTSNSAFWVAKNEQGLGDNKTALQYYQFSLQRFGKAYNPSDTAEIRADISALGGTAG